jgi:hypothetical protein
MTLQILVLIFLNGINQILMNILLQCINMLMSVITLLNLELETGISTWAWLASRAKVIRCFDIDNVTDNLKIHFQSAKDTQKDFTFTCVIYCMINRNRTN